MVSAKKMERASRLRQTLVKLRDEAVALYAVFLDRSPLVPGSVYELRTKCGKPTCACATRGQRHTCMVITWYADGRKHLRSISPKEEDELQRLTKAYRQYRQARARLVDIQTQTLAVLDQLAALRRQEP